MVIDAIRARVRAARESGRQRRRLNSANPALALMERRSWMLLFLLLLGMFLHGSAHADKEVVTWYQTDEQGTVLATRNDGKPYLHEREFSPYGKGRTPTFGLGPGYTGHLYDERHDGLVYMQGRYYDALTSRFLSVDPVVGAPGDVHDFNRYAYARNNPHRYIDPDGRTAILAIAGVIYETGEWLSGNGFDGSHLGGALAEGYTGENANIGAAAFGDVSAIVPMARIPNVARIAIGSTAEKAARLASSYAKGKVAESVAKRELIAEGNKILGSQVAANTSAGRRVIDHLIQTPQGKMLAVEVKSGNAVRSGSQLGKDGLMASEGATLVGKNAPIDRTGRLINIETIERRYPDL